MKKKKVFCFFVFMMGISILSCSLAMSFWDLPSYHWAYTTIMNLVDEEVINGYPDGSYQPENSVTRAEFLKLVLSTLYGDNRYFESSALKSVHWAFPYVWEARNCGYIAEDYIMHIQEMNQKITRLEMADILARVCEKNRIKAEEINVIPSFSDIKGLNSESRGHINLVAKIGFIKGYPDGTFGPEKTMTRAECATIIERLLNAI